MLKNVCSNTAIGNETLKEVTEYKIGHTACKIAAGFSFRGESLNEILSRIIKRKLKRRHESDMIGNSADHAKKQMKVIDLPN